jgi:hypothetical protein
MKKKKYYMNKRKIIMKISKKVLIPVMFTMLIILISCEYKSKNMPENEGQSLKYTEINLDNITDSLILKLELIWDTSPQPDKNSLNTSKNKNEYIDGIKCLIQGPKTDFYCLCAKLDKLVRFSENGEYLETTCHSGSGPGEVLYPGWMYRSSNNNIYIYDKNNVRFQVLDSNGKYFKDYKNIKQNEWSANFAVTKRKGIITRTEWNDSCLLNYYDSTGKFIKKIGLYPFPDYSVSLKRITERIILLDSDTEDFVYCIFMDFPIIRKYDYTGLLIEETHFTGKFVEKYWKEHEEYISDYQKAIKKYNGKKLFVTSANLIKNGNLLINISDYGTIEINLRNNHENNINKYILQGIDDPDPDVKNGLKYAVINNKIYAGVGQRIYREINRLIY